MADLPLHMVGLDAAAAQTLGSKGKHSPREVLALSEMELAELLDLSGEDASSILALLSSAVTPKLHTRLDAHMGGGLPHASIIELVGPAGIGKSQLCHMLSILALLPSIRRHSPEDKRSTVIYFDTERKFSPQRLVEMALAAHTTMFQDPKALQHLTQQIQVIRPSTPEELAGYLQDLTAAIIQQRVCLVIIDSIAALLRAQTGQLHLGQRQQLLGHQASVLKRAADDFRIPIVVTNQVTANMDSAHPQAPGHAGDETVVAALGTLWAHAVNVRLVLEVQNNLRLLTVAKSPAAPQASFPYMVTKKGVEEVAAEPVRRPEPGAQTISNTVLYQASHGS